MCCVTCRARPHAGNVQPSQRLCDGAGSCRGHVCTPAGISRSQGRGVLVGCGSQHEDCTAGEPAPALPVSTGAVTDPCHKQCRHAQHCVSCCQQAQCCGVRHAGVWLLMPCCDCLVLWITCMSLCHSRPPRHRQLLNVGGARSQLQLCYVQGSVVLGSRQASEGMCILLSRPPPSGFCFQRLQCAACRSGGRVASTWNAQGTAEKQYVHAQGGMQEPLQAEGFKGGVYAVAMDAMGTLLVAGSPESAIRVSDPRTGSKTFKLRGHTDNIRSAPGCLAYRSCTGPQHCLCLHTI